MTVLEDLPLERTLDAASGLWLVDPLAGEAPVTREAISVPQPRPLPATPAANWSGALEASAHADREPSAHGRPPGGSAQMPQRPVRPSKPDVDSPVPEAGDVVEHFAFGRCEVVKSDGDRLHLRSPKTAESAKSRSRCSVSPLWTPRGRDADSNSSVGSEPLPRLTVWAEED